MRPSPLIRPFGPPSPRRGEETSRAVANFRKVGEVSENIAPGRRWRAAPDEGASPNA